MNRGIIKEKYLILSSWWAKEFLYIFQDLDEDIVRKARELNLSADFSDISIHAGSVLARLSDEENTNIRVEFALEPLDETDLAHCKDFLASGSLLLTEIALGKLPSILNEELLGSDIELIPANINTYKSRSSYSSNSSFPKAGDFCEYSLALVYKLAAEIDKDAKLWLNFRGLGNLISELSFTDEKTKLKIFEDILKACEDFEVALDDISLEKVSGLKDYNQDLSKLHFDYASALSLLEDKPSFDEELDFKQFLLEIYNLAASKSDTLYDKWLDKSRNRKAETDLELSLNKEASSYFDLFQFSIPIKKLLRYSLNQDLNSVYSADLCFTLLMLQTAVLISKNGLYFPEIVDDTNAIFIRYKPIFNNDELSLRLAELYRLCPDEFFIKSKAALDELLTYLVNFLVKDLVKNLKGFPKSDFRKAFLHDEKYSAQTLSEENNINASALWLSKLELQNFDLRPLLALEEEAKNSFRLSLNLLDLLSEAKDRLEPDLNKESLERDFPSERIEGLYKQLYLLQDYVPALKQIVSTEAKAKPKLSLNALADLLIKADHILPVLGLGLSLPESLEDLIKPCLCLKLNMNKDSHYSFEYQVLMGDKSISLETFITLLKENPSELFFYNSRYTLLAENDKELILESSRKPLIELSDFWDALFYYRLGKSGDLDLLKDSELDSHFENSFASKNFDSKEASSLVPSSLNATLKPHQLEGFNWLYENYQKGFGSCLADDMGLGKTLQVISLFSKIYLDDSLKNISLVLCPSSLTKNWLSECAKFAPKLKVKAIQEIQSIEDLEQVNVLVSSYTSYRHKLNILGNYHWETLVLDEAHNIRNPASKQSQLVRSLQARCKVALTATPIEKKLSDLWTIFDFINPAYLRSLKEFTYEFAIPVEKYREKSKMKTLEHVLAPFMLRREKSTGALAEDFVKKNVETHLLSLKPEQKEIYKSRYKEFLENLKSASPVERVRLIQQSFRDLTLFLNDSENSAKAEKLLDTLNPILNAGEKVVIFTQFKERAEDLKVFLDKALGHEALLYHGAISAKKRADALSEFADSSEKQILIITIKAGGTGLNLVQANHLVHYDFTWNKAQENQASDRIYRIGQTKDVFIHRLISRGTFEQKFDRILENKSENEIKSIDLNKFSDKELGDFR